MSRKISDERLSRRFSRALRHNPGEYGLVLRDDGSADLMDFIRAMQTDLETVQRIVQQDEKSRYVIAGQRIYATQGHSFPVTIKLEQVHNPGRMFHGTKAHLLDSIRAQGLVPGSRQWVHLSANVEAARDVASRRKGTNVILTIDGNSLVAENHCVWRAENGVLLADLVPWECIVCVEFV